MRLQVEDTWEFCEDKLKSGPTSKSKATVIEFSAEDWQ